MERTEFVLAAASAAGSDSLTPVQVQKLFFLLDENVAKKADGPYFDFQPYDYGPFDKEVYREFEKLAETGFVEVTISGGMRVYRLTNEGFHAGSEVFQNFEGPIQEYIKQATEFVRSLSFPQLVSAIYEAYPEMKKNSVFA